MNSVLEDEQMKIFFEDKSYHSVKFKLEINPMTNCIFSTWSCLRPVIPA